MSYTCRVCTVIYQLAQFAFAREFLPNLCGCIQFLFRALSMSSLAAQLKRIAVPSLVAAQVDVSASARSAAAARATGRASILFDARKAAEMENALVYATGVNGMAELIQLR